MDPRKCFELMLDAGTSFDSYAYNGYRDDLMTWFRNGGFGFDATLPNGTPVFVERLLATGEAHVRYRNNRRRIVPVRDIHV